MMDLMKMMRHVEYLMNFMNNVFSNCRYFVIYGFKFFTKKKAIYIDNYDTRNHGIEGTSTVKWYDCLQTEYSLLLI